MKPDTSHMIPKEKIELETFINAVDKFVNEYVRVCDVKCEYSDMWQEATDDLASANELIKAYESEIASLEDDCTVLKKEIENLKIDNRELQAIINYLESKLVNP